MDQIEIWKPVAGYDGLYEVSNTGKVRSLERMTDAGIRGIGRELKQYSTSYGYQDVVLSKSGHAKHKRVHRLVAEAFIQNSDNKPQVNHIDGNKQNNAADNLEWCTDSENMIHAYRSGLQKTTRSGPVRKVVCLDDGNEFSTAGEAARYYGLNVRTVFSQCQRKSRGRNFTFRFSSDRKDGAE